MTDDLLHGDQLITKASLIDDLGNICEYPDDSTDKYQFIGSKVPFDSMVHIVTAGHISFGIFAQHLLYHWITYSP